MMWKMGELRILLADDHAVLRHGLRKILEDHPGWQVVAEAANGRDAVAAAVTHVPDVAVFDIAMPQLNGIEATRQVLRRELGIRVLILSMHDDRGYITQAVAAGARGYVLKVSAGSDIVDAVGALAAGKSFFSPSVAAGLFDDYSRNAGRRATLDRYDLLSEREREVLQLVAEGRSTKEIAGLLSISPATVETHRTRILQKLDLKNTAGVVLFAARRGIVS
jgi:DNA-binding NarL/FixJ family response regulator